MKNVLFLQVNTFLYTVFAAIHLWLLPSTLHFSGQINNVSQHLPELNITICLYYSLLLHGTPANNYAMLLCSFLERHCTCHFLIQPKSLSRCSTNELLSDSFAAMMCQSTLLHISIIGLVFFPPLKWYSCLFCHTNAGEILSISFFITLVKLLTPLLPLCHSSHCCTGSSLSTEIHLVLYLYFSISHTILSSLLFHLSIISPYPCAAQISSRISFSQNLTRNFSIYFHVWFIPTFLLHSYT